MRRFLLICGTLFPCLLHGGLVSMSISAVGPDGSDIANNGSLVFAWNANGNAAATPVVNGIPFPNAQPAAMTIAGFPALVNEGTGATTTLTMAHYSGDMAEVMGDYMGTNANSNGTVTLNSLTVGTTYRVQFLHHQDINDNSQRTLRVLFGTGPSATGYAGAGNDIGYISTVVFTADAATQAFTLNPNSTSRAMLNGIVLHEVPPVNVTVTSPISRQVIQRDATNTGDIPISGTYNGTYDRIEARAVVMAGGANNGTTTAWATIDDTLSGGTFSGTLNDVPAGGWYQIEIRTVVAEVPGETITVTRVGVGDLYLTCGQSNAANRGLPAFSPNEDRFSAMNYSNAQWTLATDPMPGASVGGGQGSVWSRLGKMLVDRDHVPVAMVCFAESGSDIALWLPSANNLYPRIRTAVQRFPHNGFKGILWHQGETNAQASVATSTAQYQSWLTTIIAQSRTDAGWTVPWFVAEASRIGGGLVYEDPIAAAQRAVIYADPQVFPGSYTDNFNQEAKLYDGVHSNDLGFTDHATQWAEVLGGTPQLAPKNGDIENNIALADGATFTIPPADTTSPSVIAWRALTATNDGAAAGCGYYNPDHTSYLNADDTGENGGVLPHMSGKHVAYLSDSPANTCFLQSRRALLQANITYTLTAAIGVRSTSPTTFGGATVELLADGNVLASSTIDRAALDALNSGNAAGTFSDVATTFTSGPVTPGQAISIRIRKPGGAGTYLDFDNVRLVTSATTPATPVSWSGSTSTDWADGSNWTGGTAPADNTTSDTAVFNLATYPNQPTAGTRSVSGMKIGDGATVTAPLTVLGTQLTLGGNGIDMQANAAAAILDTPVILSVGQTWTNDSASPLSVILGSGAAGSLSNGGFALTTGGSGPINFSRSLTGAGSLVKNGGGTLTLGAANTYSGSTSISAGTLEITGAGSLGSGSYSGAITNNGTLKYRSSADQTLSGILSGTGALTKDIGAGTLTLSGANTFTGIVNANSGTLASATASTASGSFLGGAGSSPSRRTVNIASGAQIRFDSPAGNSFLNLGGTVATGGYGSFYDINISGTLAIHDGIVGSNHQILQSTYHLIDGGVITKTTGSYSGAYASLLFGFGGAGGGNINVTGTGNQITTDSIAFFNGATVTTDAGADLTITSQVGGGTTSAASSILNKAGAGTLTLTGANNYAGATTVSAGRLVFQNNSVTHASPITNHSVVEFNTTAGSAYKAAIGGTGTYYKTGNGITQFNTAGQAITASGQFYIQAGAIQNNGNSVNWSGNPSVDISTSAILDLYADPIKIDKLTGTGIVQNNFANNTGAQSGSAGGYEKLTVGSANGSSTFDGVIRNNSSTNAVTVNGGNLKGGVDLEKTGTGTLTLTATNTYSGVTTVSGGKLLINGAKSGTGVVTVATTATLGGSGSIAGATTVQSGGTIAPGNSPGNLSFTSAVNLQAGSTYAAEIASAVSNDKITATGTLTVSGTIKVTLLGGYSPATGTIFDLADATIGGSPTIANFDFTAAPLSAGLSWDISSFTTNGTIKVVGTVTDPFNAWASNNNVTGGKGGDDDHDGVSNLLEFATAANPQSGSSGARVYPLVQPISGQNILTYTVAVRAAATFAANGSKQQADKDAVRYTIEGSDQLGTWNSVVVTELAAPDASNVQAALAAQLNGLDPAWTWHSFRTDGDTASDPGDFIRLVVTEIP